MYLPVYIFYCSSLYVFIVLPAQRNFKMFSRSPFSLSASFYLASNYSTSRLLTFNSKVIRNSFIFYPPSILQRTPSHNKMQ